MAPAAASLRCAALLCIAAVAVAAAPPASGGASPRPSKYNPVADPAAVVTLGAARFTVLTDRGSMDLEANNPKDADNWVKAISLLLKVFRENPQAL